ncbi:DNA/RNA nuclease SfsA [Marinomonas algicola]|uniref:DNA/RNA nuclease SfsA n=1 Tax=Marinomonas algicola TaxID=2773454 RepID=UPI00174AF54E|nr:DNA/RNA nuclease SfsA [Marinomonas algicola]
MQFAAPLIEARLIKRYKRFLTDVALPDGSEITVHCPNTGSMRRCQQNNARVWISKSDNPKRKYAFTWELVEVDQVHLACINTSLPNKIVKEAIDSGVIVELQGYGFHKAEVKYGEKSRIDWLLSTSTDMKENQCFVEVKNVTLLEEGTEGYFPDAVTERGRKHLYELASMVKQGHRAVLLFCVSHTGIDSVRPASYIDPKYAEALKEVVSVGVEVIAYKALITEKEIKLEQKINVIL